MDNMVGFDWVDYFHCLSQDAIHELAAWLAAQQLEVWEFTDIVDRAYAQLPGGPDRGSAEFVARVGRPAAEAYAGRKRLFTRLMATLIALEDARMSGALPGEVALGELQPRPTPSTRLRSEDELLGALERARSGSR
jgi:hypothetical protein